ncbi:hypothetical protein Enr13x_42490 [Stieleria neptunia]|uniref:Uncharacterized protein n=1 Tax=Stieleria neptunia TaxID=2527979 RepID=A0A518HU88_9BACT|nr:hypothetical protein [Stieleria neptunia]QDV44384.1 hypothetical protein Enr13x_42490 [Stieleria neptunia]
MNDDGNLLVDHVSRKICDCARQAADRLMQITFLWCDRKSIYDGHPAPGSYSALLDRPESGTTIVDGRDILQVAGLDADSDRATLERALPDRDEGEPGSIGRRITAIRQINHAAAMKLLRLAERARSYEPRSHEPRKRLSREEIVERLNVAAVRIRLTKGRPAKSQRELADEAQVSRSSVVAEYWRQNFVVATAPKVMEYRDDLCGIEPGEDGEDLWIDEIKELERQQQRDLASEGLPQRRRL